MTVSQSICNELREVIAVFIAVVCGLGIASVDKQLAHLLLLLGRKPLAAVAIEVVGAPAASDVLYVVAQADEGLSHGGIVLVDESRGHLHRLVGTEERTAVLLHGVGEDGVSALAVVGYLAARVIAQTLLAFRTMVVKTVVPRWGNLAEIEFVLHFSHVFYWFFTANIRNFSRFCKLFEQKTAKITVCCHNFICCYHS